MTVGDICMRVRLK